MTWLGSIQSGDYARLWLTNGVGHSRLRGAEGYSACAAAKTSSTWPLTFTFRQACAMRPSPPIKNVARSTPMYLRPYMFFSTHTP